MPVRLLQQTDRIYIMTSKISTGGDVDSYCTKCKLILEHIIVAMVGDAVVKVKCKTCGGIHNFKTTPVARSGAPRKNSITSKPFVQTQAVWEKTVEAAQGPELAYEMVRAYHTGDLIVHSVFGRGVVQKTFFRKCAVLFKDKERVLATSNT
jgi:hypothetical protein